MSSVKAVTALGYIDEKRGLITGVSDEIWRLAEIGLHEEESAKLLAKALEDEGFITRLGVGGMPSGLEAAWGSGRPIIGFLGEYDALPGISQKTVPYKEELRLDGHGHGCGHNLLGAGAFGAVIGLKREMEKRNLPGTIKYFGCPAEENFGGKAHMAREGVFSECDASLTWHPGSINVVRGGSSLAVTSMNIKFLGRTAHASGDPYNGRSALDALMLCNMGIEFLREHMTPKDRIHYVITQGGGQPNVVPAEATGWYYVRSPRRCEVDELYERVLNCAYGAARMTGTECEIELLDAIWEVLPNRTLEDLLASCMERVGPSKFSETHKEFAEEITKSFEPGYKEGFVKRESLPPEFADILLHEEILERPKEDPEPRGSTDVGDVSWCCPTAQFTTVCNAIGTPGHSWQYVAQAGMGIGHTGAITAAKILAEAGLELMTCPDLLEKAKAEFRERTGGTVYKCAMPEDFKPPFHQIANK